MFKRVFTGSYENCKVGNLISISGDRGKSVGFNGKAMPALAPKKLFGQFGIITLVKFLKKKI